MKINNYDPLLFFASDDGTGVGASTSEAERMREEEKKKEDTISIKMDEYAKVLKENDDLAKQLKEKLRVDDEKIRELANKIAVDKIRSELNEKELDINERAIKIAEIRDKARIYDLKLKDSNKTLNDWRRDYMRVLAEKFKIPFEIDSEKEILDTDIKNLEAFVQSSELFKESFATDSKKDDLVDKTALAIRKRREEKL